MTSAAVPMPLPLRAEIAYVRLRSNSIVVRPVPTGSLFKYTCAVGSDGMIVTRCVRC